MNEGSAGSSAGGTVTLLFTDLVGSTELLSEVGDDAAEGIRRTHFRLLRDAVRERGGQEVKNLGDGLMVVFESSVDAVGAAIAMQQAVHRHNQRAGDRHLDVRVGLNVGEPIREEDDYFGTPVVVAKRLCDRAAGGQILASELVRELVGSRGGFRFDAPAEVSLKGLPVPISACEVGWEPAAGQPIPLPPALTAGAPVAFVGRLEELGRLRGEWERVRAGERRLVLVSGDPGIGKTRLALELCRSVHGEGAAVMFGRCDEETLVPYQPFVEALRQYVAICPLDELRLQVGADRGELQGLVPELLERLPKLPPPLEGDPEGERYRLFESVASFLREGSSGRPLVVQLDDLHWADKPSLLLLKHIVRSPIQSSLLILGTYRETELAPGHPLGELLADLRRDQLFERVPLRGLEERAVGGLIGGWAGHEAPREFVHAVSEETEGNPFFVQEILRHLAEAGVIYEEAGRWTSKLTVAEMGIPQGVRDVVGRRLACLSETARGSLTVAAMLGREFGLDLLCAGGELDPGDAVEALDEALASQLIEEEAGSPGRYRFAHALIRETLYHELSATRRVREHLLIGERLERLYGEDLDQHAAELAYHFVQAAPAVDAKRAVRYSTVAGQRAAGQLAHEEAAVHYQRALDVSDLAGPERCELLLALGDAQWRSGDIENAKDTFEQAARLARTLDAPELLALAALGYGTGLGGAPFSNHSEAELIDLLEEALAALESDDSPLRVRLLSRLATELYFTAAVERRNRLSNEAVQMAERLGDPPAELIALYGRHWATFNPDGIEERLATGERMLELATRAGDREMAYRGHHIRMRALLELGEIAEADDEIEACAKLAEELREPFYAWQTTMFHAMRALHAGRLEEFDRLAATTAELGKAAPSDLVTATLGAQLAVRRWAAGLAVEVAPALSRLVEEQPQQPGWRAGFAWIAAEAGLQDDARAELERLVRDDFTTFPRDGNWITLLHLSAISCGLIGDAERAPILYELFRPYADRIMVTGVGSTTCGSCSLPLGMLAAATGEWEKAAAHFETALERNAAAGAGLWQVATLREYARMLIARDEPQDRDEAGKLIDDGLHEAEQIGMPRMLEQLLELREQLTAAAGQR